MNHEPIAVVGIGCMLPDANDPSKFWSNIKNSVDSVREIPTTHWLHEDFYDPDPKSPDRSYIKTGGFIKPYDFDPIGFGVVPNALEAIDTNQIMTLMVAHQALCDAGYTPDRDFDRENTCCIMGVTGYLKLANSLAARLGHPFWRKSMRKFGLEEDVIEQIVEDIHSNYPEWHKDSFPGLLANVVAGRVANRFNLGGCNNSVDAACASSLAAVNNAIDELRSGRSNMAIVGGVDTSNDPLMYTNFSKTQGFSPEGQAKPFSENADGTTIGEGVGAMVLKRLSDAEADGDRIYALIRSVGGSSDGKGQAVFAPSSKGQQRALRRAFKFAGVEAKTVELVEAHGTGTKAGDGVEIDALTNVFRESKRDGQWATISAVKSQIGHAKAAAGVAGMIKTVLCLHNKVIPPSIKVTEPAKALSGSPFSLNATLRPWLKPKTHPRRAGVSAAGFGGANYHCLLEEYHTYKTAPDFDWNVQLVGFSADNREELLEKLKEFNKQLFDHSDLRVLFGDTRKSYQEGAEYRLLISVANLERELVESLLAGAIDRVRDDNSAQWNDPRGIYFGSGVSQPKVAFLYPGQGSQYVDMARELVNTFPEALDALQRAHDIVDGATDGGRSLLDIVFPKDTFAPKDAAKLEEELRKTENTQIAIGLVSLAMTNILKRFGVTPAAAAGHSFGELSALQAVGTLSEEDFLTLALARGEAMAACGKDGDLGAMLAVFSGRDIYDNYLAKEIPEINLANINSETQIVLAGPREKLEVALSLLKQKDIRAKMLNVGAAFHSPIVSGAAKVFAEAMAKADWREAQLPVYSNVTAKAYPKDALEGQKLLKSQITSSVCFHEMVGNMAEEGFDCLLEVGPSTVLTNLVKNHDKAPAGVLATNNKSARALVQLSQTLGQLAAMGCPVKLKQWDSSYREYQVPAMSKSNFRVRLTGANHIEAKAKREIKPIQKPLGSAVTNIQSTTELKERVRMSDNHTMNSSKTNAMEIMREWNRQSMEFTNAMIAHRERSEQQMLRALGLSAENSMENTSNLVDSQPMTTQPNMTEQVVTEQPVVVETRVGTSAPVVETTPPSAASVTTNELGADAVNQIKSIIADKTGFPVEAIFDDAELEGDLGIDSIKKVEIFAALKDEMPQFSGVELSTLQEAKTLTDIRSAAAPSANAVGAGIANDANRDVYQEDVKNIIASKTGYPVDSIDSEMDFDNDLGLDSIKRVEIFGALSERFPNANIMAADGSNLRTVAAIVDFVLSTEGPTVDAAIESAVSTELAAEFGETLRQIVHEKTGFPLEAIELDAPLEEDLGIDSIKRVEIFSHFKDQCGLEEISLSDLQETKTLREAVALAKVDTFESNKVEPKAPAVSTPNLSEAPVATSTNQTQLSPSSEAASSAERHGLDVYEMSFTPLDLDSLDEFLAPKGSVFYLTQDDVALATGLAKSLQKRGFETRFVDTSRPEFASDAFGLVVTADSDADWDLQNAQEVFATAKAFLGLFTSEKPGYFATITQNGGRFGADAELGEGFMPVQGALCGLTKTVMHEYPSIFARAIDAQRDGLKVETIVQALFAKTNTEVGVTKSSLWACELASSPVRTPENIEECFGSEDVILVTGGAKGITSEIVASMAEKFKTRFALFGRSELMPSLPTWTIGIDRDEDLKAAIYRNLDNPSPALINETFEKIRSTKQIKGFLKQLQLSGAKAAYYSCDICDFAKTQETIATIEAKLGRVTGLIHGAGVIRDQLIKDKTSENFSLVWQTKVSAFENLLKATDANALKLIMGLSSSTARFGRKGQVDYAMANEALNKLIRRYKAHKPTAIAVSANFGPWDGGMVTDQIKRVFAEENISVIDRELGVADLMQRLAGADYPQVELLMIASGSDISAYSTGITQVSRLRKIAFTMDGESHPYVRSHMIGGKNVVPAAMLGEFMLEGAQNLYPELDGLSLRDFYVVRGIRFGVSEQVSVEMRYEMLASNGEVKVEIYDVTNAQRPSLAASALITAPAAENASLPEQVHVELKAAASLEVAPLYRDCLFHGKHFEGIRSVENFGKTGIEATAISAANPKNWFDTPMTKAWAVDPLLVDCVHQLIHVWAMEELKTGALPSRCSQWQVFGKIQPNRKYKIRIAIKGHNETTIFTDVDIVDKDDQILMSLRGVENVMSENILQWVGAKRSEAGMESGR